MNDAASRSVIERRVRFYAPLFLTALPAVAYLFFIFHYGVNVPIRDDFNPIPVLDRFLHGNLTFTDVWTQSNQNRQLVDWFFAFAFARFTAYNLKSIMFFDALLLVVAVAVIVQLWRSRSRSGPWDFLPVTVLFFTYIQHESALQASGRPIYLLFLFFSIMLFSLDKHEGNRNAFIVAICAALLASFSILHGLFLWPIGALYLWRTPKRLVTWFVVGLITTSIYFIGFDFHRTGDVPISPTFWNAISYWFVSIGGVFTGNSLPNVAMIFMAEIFGFFVLVFAGFATRAWLHDDFKSPALRLPMSLIALALLTNIAISVGRSAGSLEQAAASRYAPFMICYLVGTYLTLLHFARTQPHRVTFRYALVAFSVLIAFQASGGYLIGNAIAAYSQISRLGAKSTLLNYAKASDNDIKTNLWCCPDLVRSYGAMAERDRLMTFADPPGSR